MVLLLSSLALFGQGASAVFTATISDTQSTGSGAVTIALGTTATANNRLSVAASSLAPGDTVQRAITLLNTGSIDFSNVALTTTATVSSLLNTDTVNGLQISVDECSQAWTEAGVSPAYSYTCSGSSANRLASHAVVGAGMALSSSDIVAGTSRYYVVTLTLPLSAPTTMQTKSSTFNYAFTATQRAGTNR